jgi:hypothetical protein
LNADRGLLFQSKNPLGTPSELDIYIKSEIEKWSKVNKDADIRALD